MKFEDMVYVYMEGVDGAQGPEYKDGGKDVFAYRSQSQFTNGGMQTAGHLRKSPQIWTRLRIFGVSWKGLAV